MSDDIVTRLRSEAAGCNASPCDCQCPNLYAAADEIVRLRAEVALNRRALELAMKEESDTSWDLLVLHWLKEARRG